MSLEAATYLSDLVATNPTAADPMEQGANHLRLLKSVLQTTFPAVAGAVTASHTDLSAVTALRTTVSALQTGTVSTTVDTSSTASLTIAGTGKFLDAPTIRQAGVSLVPRGVIVMWSGSVSAVPTGWGLCDGTNGTPDLRGCFIAAAGASSPYPAALTTGGSPTYTGTTATAGSHSHTSATGTAGGHSHTGSTDAQGSHSHTGATQGHALTISEMPSHDHGLGTQPVIGSSGGNYLPAGGGFGAVVFSAQGGGQTHTHPIAVDGYHAHGITTNAVADHSHSISADGLHSHTVSVTGLPPYVALGMIMKL